MGRMRGASAGSLLRGIAMAAWLLFCVFLPGVAGAQDKPLTAYFRETWTTRQGLPHNQVNAIAQSPDGYLWLGTAAEHIALAKLQALAVFQHQQLFGRVHRGMAV